MIVAFRRYASSRSGAKLGLDRWIQRSRVLALWREILRTVRRIEDPATREEMRSWARHEFKRNKDVQETTQIRYLISQGRHEMETIIFHLKTVGQLSLAPRRGTYEIVSSRMYTSEKAGGLKGTYIKIEPAPLELPYRC
ncbi:uncharacterized protein DFL_004590 [Arthrobotrys flagrans]|uniref:LYR motif-containing protein 2 n=1 Tax=Arthrobotrys flagrans TaxID=97331 RepID=A0A437A5J1_ARTFL|nr:hypothetical protein DFL_004590 [Arthrobotrys flagrans]